MLHMLMWDIPDKNLSSTTPLLTCTICCYIKQQHTLACFSLYEVVYWFNSICLIQRSYCSDRAGHLRWPDHVSTEERAFYRPSHLCWRVHSRYQDRPSGMDSPNLLHERRRVLVVHPTTCCWRLVHITDLWSICALCNSKKGEKVSSSW